jgi:hypothetical protein
VGLSLYSFDISGFVTYQKKYIYFWFCKDHLFIEKKKTKQSTEHATQKVYENPYINPPFTTDGLIAPSFLEFSFANNLGSNLPFDPL